MQDYLILRLEAPLMSFGGPIVDSRGVIQSVPARSMITGLIANALGWHHRDSEKLEALQEQLRYATRCDRPGTLFTDYQTIDLGQSHLSGENGWTTRNGRQSRAGANSEKTHERYQDYLADAVYTLALWIVGDFVRPAEVESALKNPARPLFIGRKTCIPSVPIFHSRVRAATPTEALQLIPSLKGSSTCRVWLDDDGGEGRRFSVIDGRDWVNQMHTRQRWLVERVIEFGGSNE